MTLLLATACAVSYLTELFGLIPLVGHFIKDVLTLALSVVACIVLGYQGTQLIIFILAVAFIATTLRIIIDVVTSKPQIIPRRR